MEEKKMNTIFTNTSPNRIFQLRFAGKIPPVLAEDQFCQSEMVIRLTNAINAYHDAIWNDFSVGMKNFACTQEWSTLDESMFPWMNEDCVKPFIEDVRSTMTYIDKISPDIRVSVYWPACSEKKVVKALSSYMKDYIGSVSKDDENFDKAVKLGADFVNLAIEINNTILDVQMSVMFRYLSTLFKIRDYTKKWLSDECAFAVSYCLEPDATVRDIAKTAIEFIESQDNRWKEVPRSCARLIAKDTVLNFYENIKKASETLNELMEITNNKAIPKNLSNMLLGWVAYTFNLGAENNSAADDAIDNRTDCKAMVAILMRAASYAAMSPGVPRLISESVDMALYVLHHKSVEFSGEFAVYDDNSDDPESDHLYNTGITGRDFTKLSIHSFDRYLAQDLFEIQVARTFGAEGDSINYKILDGMKSPFVTGAYTTPEADIASDGRLFDATIDGTPAVWQCKLICNHLIYREDSDKGDHVVHVTEKNYKKAIRNELKNREESKEAEESNATEEDQKEDEPTKEPTKVYFLPTSEELYHMGKEHREEK